MIPRDRPQPRMTTPALAIRNLRKTYANGLEAVRGIDLDIAEGEFFALLGPNGAGKSTTIGIVCSLPSVSSARWYGKPVVAFGSSATTLTPI